MQSLDDVARLALALPQVIEGEARGRRAWLIGGKRFAWERPFSKADLQRFGDEQPPAGPILGVAMGDLGEKAAATISPTATTTHTVTTTVVSTAPPTETVSMTAQNPTVTVTYTPPTTTETITLTATVPPVLVTTYETSTSFAVVPLAQNVVAADAVANVTDCPVDPTASASAVASSLPTTGANVSVPFGIGLGLLVGGIFILSRASRRRHV